MSVDSGSSPSAFGRAQTFLSHSVYGLILTLATVGELIRHGSGARESVAWILGAGAVLLIAHLFSDVLAETAATQRDLDWGEIVRVVREDIGVTAGVPRCRPDHGRGGHRRPGRSDRPSSLRGSRIAGCCRIVVLRDSTSPSTRTGDHGPGVCCARSAHRRSREHGLSGIRSVLPA